VANQCIQARVTLYGHFKRTYQKEVKIMGKAKNKLISDEQRDKHKKRVVAHLEEKGTLELKGFKTANICCYEIFGIYDE
jgi:hypothetical protein